MWSPVTPWPLLSLSPTCTHLAEDGALKFHLPHAARVRQQAAHRHLSHPSTLQQPQPGESVLFHPPHPNQQPASEQLGLNENEESISGHHTPVRFRTYSRADTEEVAGKSTHPPDLQVLFLLGERSTSTTTPQKRTEKTDSRREERLSPPQEPDRQTDGRTRSPPDPTWRWPQALLATAAAAWPPAAPPPGRLTGRRRSRGGLAPAPPPQGGQRGGSEARSPCQGAMPGSLHSEPGPDLPQAAHSAVKSGQSSSFTCEATHKHQISQ